MHSNRKLQCEHCNICLSSVGTLKEHTALVHINVRHVTKSLPLPYHVKYTLWANMGLDSFVLDVKVALILPFNWLSTSSAMEKEQSDLPSITKLAAFYWWNRFCHHALNPFLEVF